MIRIIGSGPGDGRYILPIALEEIRHCSILAGYPRLLERFSGHEERQINFSASGKTNLHTGLREIDRLKGDAVVGILVSGDPGFYSLLGTIRSEHPAWNPMVIPGLTAFQVACAKIRLPWQDMTLISLHGGITEQFTRFLDAPGRKGAIILTGREHTPAKTAERIVSADPSLAYRNVYLCCDIGEDNERIELTTLTGVGRLSSGRLHILSLPPFPFLREKGNKG